MSPKCCSLAFDDIKEQEIDFVPELNIIVNVRHINKTLTQNTSFEANVVRVNGSFTVSF